MKEKGPLREQGKNEKRQARPRMNNGVGGGEIKGQLVSDCTIEISENDPEQPNSTRRQKS